MLRGKLLKVLINTTFCAFVRFVVGGCKSKLCLVLVLCIGEFDLKASAFLTINVNNENMYWE